MVVDHIALQADAEAAGQDKVHTTTESVEARPVRLLPGGHEDLHDRGRDRIVGLRRAVLRIAPREGRTKNVTCWKCRKVSIGPMANVWVNTCVGTASTKPGGTRPSAASWASRAAIPCWSATGSRPPVNVVSPRAFV